MSTVAELLDDIQRESGLSAPEMVLAVGVHPAVLTERGGDDVGELPPRLAARLDDLRDVTSRARRSMTAAEVRDWLLTRNAKLGRTRPIDLLSTDRDRLLDLLDSQVAPGERSELS